VIAVFGCGGDRDSGKRPQMGAIAAELADRLVLTSDNPRGEDPLAILAAIAAGIPDGAAYEVEPERGRAIERAVLGAAPGDVVVIAGKGHETYQIVGARTLHFDDRDAARAALAERAAREARA
jgi:UDP-N-acetylmuramoyl-L-alanyl-D-glutamate--2,6-diaminopimelate ligase